MTDGQREQFLTNVIYSTYSDAAVDSPVDWTSDTRMSAVFSERYLRPLGWPTTSSRIIELGCGSGNFLAFLEQRGFCRYTGIDVSPAQVRAAKQRLATDDLVEGDNVAALRAAACDSFDYIVALDVIEHYSLPDAHQLLVECRRVLRSGGRLLLQTPNAGGIFGGRGRYGDLSHLEGYTSQSIADLLHVAGFPDVSVYEVEPPNVTPKDKVRRSAWRLMSSLARAYIALETGVRRCPVSQTIIVVAR
jgi:SAM-dependent methyltransferase